MLEMVSCLLSATFYLIIFRSTFGSITLIFPVVVSMYSFSCNPIGKNPKGSNLVILEDGVLWKLCWDQKNLPALPRLHVWCGTWLHLVGSNNLFHSFLLMSHTAPQYLDKLLLLQVFTNRPFFWVTL